MEKDERLRTKSKFTRSILSMVRRVNGTLGIYFYLRIPKGFIYKGFASLCCNYLGAAFFLCIGRHFQPAHSLLGSTTILLITYFIKA